MGEKKYILEPPDGGWGWVVCFAFALGNFIYIPILQNSGLVFKTTFPKYGINATDGSVIINLNAAFGMMMGLINGSLLKKYGFRKVAVAGGFIISFGLILTSFANSFATFIITYGLITSIGFGLTSSSLSLAFNSYFKVKRGIAMGYAMSATGLGPIIMPLFVSYILDEYDTKGTILILGGLTFNSLVAASLLQPIKWHVKKKFVDDINGDTKEESKINLLTEKQNNENIEKRRESQLYGLSKIGLSSLSINHDSETQSIYGFGTPLPIRKASTVSNHEYEISNNKPAHYRRSTSYQDKRLSVSAMSSKSSVYCSIDNDLHKSTIIEEKREEETQDEEENNNKEPSRCQKIFQNFVVYFDLILLKDPIYLNLMIGMSIAICAEINFGLFTPFILNDMNFTTFEIANIMALTAATDIVFRLCAPYVASYLKFNCRVMYMLSLILLIITRTGLIFVVTLKEAFAVAFFLGLAKGFRTVFMQLLIPSYVPIERLAAASGIQMVVNGCIIMINGPIIGKIRDVTGSYNNCIIVINCLTFVTIVMWSTEMLHIRYKNKKALNIT